jgi:hypothetical protein
VRRLRDLVLPGRANGTGDGGDSAERSITNKRKGLVALIAGALVALWLVGSSESFHDCEHTRKTHQSYQNSHDKVGLFIRDIVRLKLHAACARSTIGENDNAIVALATIVLAIFTWALWNSTDKLWISAERQRNAERVQRFNDTRRENSALAETRRAAKAAEDQSILARQEFILVHRPRIHIRNIVVRHPKSVVGWTPDDIFRINEQVSGQFYIANRGDVDAWVTEILTMVRWYGVAHLPMERPYEGRDGDKKAIPVRIPASRSLQVTFSSSKLMDNAAANILAGAEGHRLYIMGFVEYRDQAAVDRGLPSRTYRTAFCRVFSATARRFVPVDDEDYEHEE